MDTTATASLVPSHVASRGVRMLPMPKPETAAIAPAIIPAHVTSTVCVMGGRPLHSAHVGTTPLFATGFPHNPLHTTYSSTLTILVEHPQEGPCLNVAGIRTSSSPHRLLNARRRLQDRAPGGSRKGTEQASRG